MLLNDLAPPARLSPASAAVWREVAPLLRRVQVLTELDVIALEMLCDAVADYRHARTVRGDDFVVKSGKGSEMISQWMVAAQMASKRAEGFMGKFGMDPASRTRLMVQPQGELFDTSNAGADRFFQR